MTTEEIPKAVWEGMFRVFGINVRCAVLDNGKRVINGDDLLQVLSGNSDTLSHDDLDEFIKWQAGEGIPDEQPKTNA